MTVHRIGARCSIVVIARLDRAIQRANARPAFLDAPVKPGHDGRAQWGSRR